MQRLFRNFGHITGYSAEIFIGTTFFIFIGYLIFFYVSTPTIIFLINTSDYHCTEGMKDFYTTMQSLSYIAWPLCFQVIFFGVIWELTRI